MTDAELVVDASVLLRGLLDEGARAREIVDGVRSGSVHGHAPDLIGAETTHALVRLARAGRLEERWALRLADEVDTLPLQRHPTTGRAGPALHLALEAGLSGYDAHYALLAEALDVPLVTADRALAGAVGRALLVA